MEKNFHNFGNIDPRQLQKIAQSDTAKQLLSLLQSTQGENLQRAMDSAGSGNMDRTREILQQMLSSPQAQVLLSRLQEEQNG